MPIPYPFTFSREVDFCDTDAAGIGHFSLYFRLMEAGEAALFRALNLSLLSVNGAQGEGFPRVEVHCKFRKPVFFGDRILGEMRLLDSDHRRLHFDFRFLRAVEPPQRCAHGQIVTTFARRAEDGSMHGAPIPDAVLTAVRAWAHAEFSVAH